MLQLRYIISLLAIGLTLDGMTLLTAVFENTFLCFFRFQKTWLFTFFWNDVSKSRKKSL